MTCRKECPLPGQSALAARPTLTFQAPTTITITITIFPSISAYPHFALQPRVRSGVLVRAFQASRHHATDERAQGGRAIQELSCQEPGRLSFGR